MKTINYQIEFFSFWHVSSGLTGSAYADMLVNKTKKGLPYIPGRTLKGLLRDAAETIHKFSSELVCTEFIQEVFGIDPAEESEGHFDLEAQCFFTNARLSNYLENSISPRDASYLYQVITSTRIDKNGLASTGTLRRIETTVPLTLYASIEQFPEDEKNLIQLENCMKWIKRMGMQRSRGLGKCQFSIEI